MRRDDDACIQRNGCSVYVENLKDSIVKVTVVKGDKELEYLLSAEEVLLAKFNVLGIVTEEMIAKMNEGDNR